MLSNPSMTLQEFTELFGGLELTPAQREALKRIGRGEQLTLDVFADSRNIRRATFGSVRPVNGGFEEKDERTGEVRDPPLERDWTSDPWQQ